MSTAPEYKPVSTEHLLTCLDLAIDEAKLVRSLINSKDLARKLKSDAPFSQRLIYLNREIAYLEEKLTEVRSQTKSSKLY